MIQPYVFGILRKARARCFLKLTASKWCAANGRRVKEGDVGSSLDPGTKI